MQGSVWFMRDSFLAAAFYFLEPAFPEKDGFFVEICLQIGNRVYVVGGHGIFRI